jgi:hypothetical protein
MRGVEVAVQVEHLDRLRLQRQPLRPQEDRGGRQGGDPEQRAEPEQLQQPQKPSLDPADL